ncbi:MAG: hypothetical protein IKN09_01880 [Clostridia bacterium]|nr:hypothetical protein [Clostridia bacterium]
MELLTMLILSVVLILILIVLLGFNIKNIKIIKQIGENKELNNTTDVLPENEQICKDILKMLNNEDVNIKQGSENSKSSLYIVATNSILIANIKSTFTRVQTIAHECIHSVQDKRLLWFNFIFSNIYLLYFTITFVLSVFNKLPMVNMFAIILIMMSLLLYFVRSYLEIDAMTKARYLAKEYMEDNKDLISQRDIDTVIENYDKLNKVGVKFYCFNLIFKYLIKIIIFCVAAIL